MITDGQLEIVEEDYGSSLTEISNGLYRMFISTFDLCRSLCSEQGSSVAEVPDEF